MNTATGGVKKASTNATIIRIIGSVEILRELHARRIIRRYEAPPEVADSPVH